MNAMIKHPKPPPPPRRTSSRRTSGETLAGTAAAPVTRPATAPQRGEPAREQTAPGYQLSANTPVTTAATLWRYRGQLRLTLAAKCVFRIGSNGGLIAVAGSEPAPDELMVQGQISHPCEQVPLVGRAEVYLVGYAYPCAQTPGYGSASLTVSRGQQRVIDKRVTVCGPRDASGRPGSFPYLRISYDHAYGGPGFADNPLGRGYGSTSNCAPNLIDPDDARKVACFAPIPSLFPARRNLLNGLERGRLRAPLVELPDEFDWGYLQAAPADQRLDVLQGDESVEVLGMQPDGRALRFALPSLVANAQVTRADGGGSRMVSMMLSQLHIDAHSRLCTLVWRGSLTVLDQQDAQNLRARLHVGMRTQSSAGQVLEKYSRDSAVAAAASAAATLLLASRRASATLPAAERAVSANDHAPFPLASGSPAQKVTLPGAPWSRERAAQPLPPRKGSATLVEPPQDVDPALLAGSGASIRDSSIDMQAFVLAQSWPAAAQKTTPPPEPAHAETEPACAANAEREQAAQAARDHAELAERQAATLAAERATKAERHAAEEAARHAKVKAEREAEERRALEHKRFEEAQERAKEAERRRLQQEVEERRDRARKLRASLYSQRN